MVCLKDLNEFLKAVSNFVPTNRIAFFRKLEPDISTQLSKIENRYEYTAFQTSGYEGKVAMEQLILREPKSTIYKLKLITYPGVIRIANPSYLPVQMLTRTAFGHKVDILPRRRINLSRRRINLSLQLVFLSEKGLRRPGINSPEFLTVKMKEEIDAYNKEFQRLQMSNNPSSGIQTVPEGDSVQIVGRLSGNSSRISETRRSSMVSDDDFFEFLRLQ